MSAQARSERVSSDDAARRPQTTVVLLDQVETLVSGWWADRALWARIGRYARCAEGSLDPDDWFRVSAEAEMARQEAAATIAVCEDCLVRTQCLELSLRHWDIGKHGVWGGLVAADRAKLRARLLADPKADLGPPLTG